MTGIVQDDIGRDDLKQLTQHLACQGHPAPETHWRKWAGCRAGSWDSNCHSRCSNQNFSAGFMETLIVAGKQTPLHPRSETAKGLSSRCFEKEKKAEACRDYYRDENGSWRTPFNLLPSEGCLGQGPYFISVTWKIGWCLCRHLVLHVKALFSIFIMAIRMNLPELNGERLCI